MSLDDACRLLKVAPADPWERVEQNRRKLVLPSHPDRLRALTPAQAEQARADALRVNEAYLVIAARRAGRP